MFRKADKTGYTTSMPGIQMKTLVYGNKTLLAEFVLQKGNILTEHTHSHEQTGYLITGHIRLKIGDIIHEALPGDSWCIPSDIKHGAQIIEDSIAVEVFSPVREDFLPENSK